MARKALLIHFISDFIRDEDLRRRVLLNDEEGAREYGLNDDQIRTLATLRPELILGEIGRELAELGIDAGRKAEDLVEGDYGQLADRAKYSPAMIYVFDVDPPTIAAGRRELVTVRANGLDRHPEVQFIQSSEEGDVVVNGIVVDVSCDMDLNQRASVYVALRPGTWRVEARNPGVHSAVRRHATLIVR